MPLSIARPWFTAMFATLIAGMFSPANAQTVDRMWRDSCASCHGVTGQGSEQAGSLLDQQWSWVGSAADRQDPPGEAADGWIRGLFDAVKSGHRDVPGIESPRFDQTLSDPRVWALVNYLLELRASDHRLRGGGPTRDARGVYSSAHRTYRVEEVITADVRTPWGIAFCPDLGDPSAEPLSRAMLITEKSGRLRVYSDKAGGGRLSGPVEGIPAVSDAGQGGLMGLCLHPNFKDNRLVYLSYAESIDGDARRVMTTIIRGRLTPGSAGRWAWETERVIFRARPEHFLSPGVHYGCRIVFDPTDPTILFFAIGERGRMDMAQDLTRPNGKVHRVRDDGSIPIDNPFASNSGPVYKSIWTYGNRNPQGLAFDLEGNLWSTEHGPRGGDELNLIVKGRNYGWPVVSHGINYDGHPFRVPWPDLAGKREASMDAGVVETSPDTIA
ncbi:MAG TPA: PQQ-dependent sugar dehydrogenase, partial [Phycisphaerales bacterium]|nr:PQQ-dependent sugar dehydrogenase [Phycisphaerales bacterium]